MSVFFTADTHFNHGNIIDYCKRPFKTAVEMNDAIIDRWNARIKAEDLVYHLGDFAFARDKRDFDNIFRRLNGRIVLIKGNHDKIAVLNRHKFHAFYDSYKEIELVVGQPITLCHYSMRVWNRSHRGAWHLYGHSHGTLPDDPNSLSFDVGVDCHNFTPLSYDEVVAIMMKKTFKPIDYHGRSADIATK